jgi:hypothetical protein
VAATVDQVKLRLAGQLHKSLPATDPAAPGADVTALDGFWTPIVARATAGSEAWLREFLTAWGVGDDWMATSPLFRDWHERRAVYQCGIDDGAQLTVDQRPLLFKLDPTEEIVALMKVGRIPGNTESSVGVGLLERDDDLFRRPSVNGNGSLPADIFNTPQPWAGRDVWR